ncbi:MAG: HelD family protein [Acidimicrobiales bacterium]
MHIDGAYGLLTEMDSRTSAAERDAASRAAGDWDATMAQRHLAQRLTSLRDDSSPLCFGRIDDEDGIWHIGRRHVEDGKGDPVVVDWRAPKAVPYYRATFADPLMLARRQRFLLDGRRVADVLDEDFATPASDGVASGAGLPDPLLATLGYARGGTMRDIVATIAAEQDHIIRAPLGRAVVVQGGPGTGKTAVGLHRAAFLLYEHRRSLERDGVLVIGPNRLFLSYIAEVLPSLGEVAVTQTTLGGLVPQWPVRAEEPDGVAAMKGDRRIADLLAAATRALLRPPADALRVVTRWGGTTLEAADLGALLEAAWASGGSFGDRRARFRRAVTDVVTRRLRERRPAAIDAQDVARDIASDRDAGAALGRMWPSTSAVALVRRVYARPGAVAYGILDGREAKMLTRRTSAPGATRWTEADLPVLDEAAALLSASTRAYGHVVVDEAQDFSEMALRMLRRRSRDGCSFTVLGDLAQATAPGALGDWRRTLTALGEPPGAAIEPLTVGYRVPEAIMALANAYLAANAPHLEPTRSVRRDGEVPRFVSVEGPLGAALVPVVRELVERYQTVAVIGPAGLLAGARPELEDRGVACAPPGTPARAGRLSIVPVADAKGLEFDAVVVVEPLDVASVAGGVGLLYIALTRAVQHLSVLHTGALPDGLGPDAGTAPQSAPLGTHRKPEARAS